MPGWTPRALPPRTALEGRFCRVEPLDVDRHADSLFAAYEEAPDARDWTYLPNERESDPTAFHAFVAERARSADPLHMAVVCEGEALGCAALMRIDPLNGVIELGHIHFAPRLQRTPAATEALFLLMRRAFDEFGYRRLEWKCDNLNEPSRRAAERLGFDFEGVFRDAVVTKARSRDSAWYAMRTTSWSRTRAQFEAWLDAGNFDVNDRQLSRLASIKVDGA